MAAVVVVDAGQGTRQGKVADEEGQQTPPPPEPVATARRHRQPTPDHPPYCWMINEAIEAMGEDGGLEEDSISAFIRARYPGVPAAHDRLLRHYLAKHVAEGFFVCTAPGRYERVSEECLVDQAPARVGSPAAEAKRGRGRPRKDGSSSTSPANKKDDSMGRRSTTLGRRAAATADKHGSSSTHKRRRLSRGALPVAVDSVPTPLVAVADKKDGSQAASLKPICCVKRRASKRLVAAEDSVPTLPVAVADKKDGSQAASSTPKRRGRLRMATATDNSGGALVAGKEDSREVPYTTDKEHEPPRELALVIVGSGSATTSSAMDKACAEVTPTMPMDVGQPFELALVTTTNVPAPTPTMDKKDGRDAPSFNMALVPKDDGICATPTAPEPSSQACVVQALVAPDHGPVPVLVAGLEEAPSATNKHVLQPRKAGSAPAAGKKALSATTKARRRECKSSVVARSALTPVAGKKAAGLKVSFASPKLIPAIAGGCPASVPLKSQGRPRKLYPVTADEIPRDPACVLLALPSQPPPAANA
ncbi:hypothetical protein U9M48_033351 [Paspalum notatum var. saurae]|uniref:H15 domain-containing protein n=1 Tax=Paspalum notatum var. saurae TaxID=547442 RepID=A0AAQ3UB51_PASNO